MTLDPLAPKPGVYFDVPMSEYRKVQALNHSTLRHIRRSPAHLMHAAMNPTESSDAQNLGSALHVWALQRELYEREVCVAPDVDCRTKAGKQIYNNFIANAAGKIVIDADQAKLVKPMSLAIGAHDEARRYRSAKGRSEIVIVWQDPAGVLCKGRIDKAVIRPDGSWLRVDIKTTRHATPSLFAKDAANFGYHTQDAFYTRGLEVLGINDHGEIIIAVETEPPHAVEVFKFGADSRRTGKELITAWLAEYVKCQRENHWPNINNPVQEIELPGWAILPDLGDNEEEEERKWIAPMAQAS